MSKEQKHIAILGGGIIGLCSAWYLTGAGHRVSIVDRNPPLQISGCSFGNAGMIVPSHFVPLAAPGAISNGIKWMFDPESPLYIKPRTSLDLTRWLNAFRKAATRRRAEAAMPVLKKLGLESRRLFEELNAELELDLERKGLLMLCATESGLHEEKELAEKADRYGITTRTFDRDSVAEMLPDIPSEVVGAVLYPGDAHLHPHQLMSKLTQALRERGVTFHYSTAVTGVTTNPQGIAALETEEGKITADEYVMAAGIWSSQLCKSLGVRLPMQGGKGYSLTAESPVEFPTPLILVEGKVAVTPLPGQLRIGGTMEIDGLREEINQRRINGILKSFQRFFPDYDLSGHRDAEPWYGFRPVSPDGLPYIGRSNQHQNLLIASGHAMMGISLAPVTGRIIRDVVEGLTATQPLLDPNRFQS